MPSETELTNVALRKAGARRISSIDETVANAGVARDIYTTERDDLLRLHPWNFAITRAALAELAVAPVYEFANAFSLPADWMRTLEVHDNDAGDAVVRYKMETIQQADDTYVACIVTDSDALWLKYIRRITDTSAMSATFHQVLILRMAKIFAESASTKEVLDRELAAAMRLARSIDGMEDWPDKLPEGRWVVSRWAHGWMRRTTWP